MSEYWVLQQTKNERRNYYEYLVMYDVTFFGRLAFETY